MHSEKTLGAGILYFRTHPKFHDFCGIAAAQITFPQYSLGFGVSPIALCLSHQGNLTHLPAFGNNSYKCHSHIFLGGN